MRGPPNCEAASCSVSMVMEKVRPATVIMEPAIAESTARAPPVQGVEPAELADRFDAQKPVELNQQDGQGECGRSHGRGQETRS